MKKSFYKEAVNKLMDYNKRYPDSPLKCAFKAGSFGFIWALGNILSGRKRTWKSDNRVIKVAFILSNMIGDICRHFDRNCLKTASLIFIQI